jgi:hypothetical protein
MEDDIRDTPRNLNTELISEETNVNERILTGSIWKILAGTENLICLR